MNRFHFSRRASWAGLGLWCLTAGLLAQAALASDLKEGKKAFEAGEFDKALKSFEAAARQGYAEGRAWVGRVWLRRRHLDEAWVAFETAQKMDPILAMPYYGQGEVLRQRGKCDAAVPLFQRAVELDRKFPEAQLALGYCLITNRKFEEATDALSRGLKWGEKWRPKFLVALGQAELARDSLRDAGIYFTRAREEAPQDPAPRRALGDFYVKRGTFVLAIPEYQSALEMDPEDVETRYALGRALFYAQRYNEALDVYLEVVARDPEFPPGQLALGDLYYRSGAADRRRYLDARGPLEKYVALVPDDPKGWSVLGRTYYQIGQRDSALTALNRAEALGDQNKEMYTIRARVHVDRRDWDEALADYARGEPAAEDQLRIAQVLVFKGQPQRADSLYRDIIERDSASSYGKFALKELGKLRYRDKNYPAAAGIFNRLIALDPSNDEAYYYLGLSHKQLGDNPAALKALSRAAELADRSADRHFWLGMVLADVDSVSRARRELERAVELDSTGVTQNSGFALRQLGYYKLLDKQFEEATGLLERSVAINEGDLQAWVWLAQGYHNAGKRAKACAAYDRALQIDSGQAIAQKGKESLGCSEPQRGGAP